jgi:hypothetical protein
LALLSFGFDKLSLRGFKCALELDIGYSRLDIEYFKILFADVLPDVYFAVSLHFGVSSVERERTESNPANPVRN